MFTKDTLKTKTFWGGIIAVVTGVGMIVQGETGAGIQTVVAGVMAMFLRDAITKG